MLLSNLSDKNIILASKSPRRQQLLKGLDIDFEIRTKDVDEIYPESLTPEQVAIYLSELKASAFVEELKKNDLLITSDTIVVWNGKIVEKPKDREDAIQMISNLSGSEHEVITGVCITNNQRKNSFFEKTKVIFNSLSTSEIEYYVDQYEPYDKAGAYGVQELIGYIAISRLEGCYYNVMGLPLQRLYKELKAY